MLKKKKTTASGEPVLVQSVRRTRSHRMKFCVQRGLGACPQQASGEENHKGIFFSAGLCVLTQALLASHSRPYLAILQSLILCAFYCTY